MLFLFPCSGHINPTPKLGELLHSRGARVTFINTEHNHERLPVAPQGRAAARRSWPCVVLSGLVSFALGVAEELAVPSFVLWGTSACGFLCTLRLRQHGYVRKVTSTRSSC
ncbi:hypothetical protein BRADI_3g42716v3 [Brachypodium distachyon]|uniref:Uncharacterized protein n=1 Tax=Brachypodium distachyon TaxID=15368 RepID=A0A0Q3M4B2_BRADI|nr:hypothetical protein BRADI_3g42716v3 [Brachypodium distachyon]